MFGHVKLITFFNLITIVWCVLLLRCTGSDAGGRRGPYSTGLGRLSTAALRNLLLRAQINAHIYHICGES